MAGWIDAIWSLAGLAPAIFLLRLKVEVKRAPDGTWSFAAQHQPLDAEALRAGVDATRHFFQRRSNPNDAP